MTGMDRRRRSALLALWGITALLIAGCSGDAGKPPAGPYRIAEVFDGDSFNLNAANGGIVRVRIAGIDAPEKSQPYAQKAKDSLIELLSSGPITLEPIKVDPYQRWIANVRTGDRDVGREQIARGYAWFFTRYRQDLNEVMQMDYERAEKEAREARRGLWAGLSAKGNPALYPEPPWEFRHRNKRP